MLLSLLSCCVSCSVCSQLCYRHCVTRSSQGDAAISSCTCARTWCLSCLCPSHLLLLEANRVALTDGCRHWSLLCSVSPLSSSDSRLSWPGLLASSGPHHREGAAGHPTSTTIGSLPRRSPPPLVFQATRLAGRLKQRTRRYSTSAPPINATFRLAFFSGLGRIRKKTQSFVRSCCSHSLLSVWQCVSFLTSFQTQLAQPLMQQYAGGSGRFSSVSSFLLLLVVLLSLCGAEAAVAGAAAANARMLRTEHASAEGRTRRSAITRIKRQPDRAHAKIPIRQAKKQR